VLGPVALYFTINYICTTCDTTYNEECVFVIDHMNVAYITVYRCVI